jgi:heme A synthase
MYFNSFYTPEKYTSLNKNMDVTLNKISMFINQTNKCTTYILTLFYISLAFLHVSMHLHHFQEALTFYFAKVTELL